MEQVKINIKATNIELTNEIRSFVEEKLNSVIKILNLNQDEEALFDVEVGKTTTGQNTGEIYRAEINLKVRSQFTRTESVQSNINLAIEKAVDEMTRKVRKNKEKNIDLVRRGALTFKKLFNRK